LATHHRREMPHEKGSRTQDKEGTTRMGTKTLANQKTQKTTRTDEGKRHERPTQVSRKDCEVEDPAKAKKNKKEGSAGKAKDGRTKTEGFFPGCRNPNCHTAKQERKRGRKGKGEKETITISGSTEKGRGGKEEDSSHRGSTKENF